MAVEVLKVYVETTIVSYLTARPSRDLIIAAHQQITQEWWENRRANFDLYTSQFVIQESSAGDAAMAQKRLEALDEIPLLSVSPEALALARALVEKVRYRKKPIPTLCILLSPPPTVWIVCYLELQAYCQCRNAKWNRKTLSCGRI